MNVLLTVLSTGLLAGCVTCVVLGIRNLQRCFEVAGKLERLRSTTIADHNTLASLAHQHRKLAARFYVVERRPTVPMPELEPRPDVNLSGMYACDNWALAQRDGPGSDAAACECDFCCESRKARRRVQAELTPKGTAGRLAAIKEGLEQP